MMKKIFALCCALMLTGCASLYYGYLPGTSYKFYKPINIIDLKGKSYDITFKDSRSNIREIECSPHSLDRNTELEGNMGFSYFQQYVTQFVENNNGSIDGASLNQVTFELEALSFRLVGAFYIVMHGFVQVRVSTPNFSKVYCADMTDHDQDAPLKWYSLVTRKTATRLIVSGAVRRVLEDIMTDLAI